MPNKAYKKGYRIETICRKELEELGFFTVRSGGSKTPVDIIAIDQNVVKLIQVKTKEFKQVTYPRDENIKKLEQLRVPINCRKEVWVWKGKKKTWKKYLLESPD